jgi:hypothetical protein
MCVGKNEPCNLFCGAVLAWKFKKLQTLHTDRLISNEKQKKQIPQWSLQSIITSGIRFYIYPKKSKKRPGHCGSNLIDKICRIQ